MNIIQLGKLYLLLPLCLVLGSGAAQTTTDWLLDGSAYKAKMETNSSQNPSRIILTNGLIKRTFLIRPNAATVGFENLVTGENILRGVKPEADITLNGVKYDIGGLKGQPNYAFLRTEDIAGLTNDPAAMRYIGYATGPIKAPFEWKQVRHHAPNPNWPPKGTYLRLDFQMPAADAVKSSGQSLPSDFGRAALLQSDMTQVEPDWTLVHSDTHERSSFQNEGKIGEIYTPAGTSVFLERAWPAGGAVLETTIDVGTDDSKEWGPGLSLVWPNKTIKFYLRPGGNTYDDGVPMFGLWDGEKEQRAAGGRQELDMSRPWVLRLRLGKAFIYCEAKPLGGTWRVIEKIPFDGKAPTAFRIGKTDAQGKRADRTESPGELVRLRVMDFAVYAAMQMGKDGPSEVPDVRVSLHYELYDGIPVMSKWMTVENRGNQPVTINDFTSDILAAVEYGSKVETREYNVAKPNIHVETDYAFASFNVDDANHHVVHWETDPDYSTQVNYLRLTPCLLKVSPEIGPEQVLEAGDQFISFRSFMLPYDSYDRERQGLSLRKMYRTLAPWTTENPLMMHARFADWEQVKRAIDQSAEVGFEMVILTFGSGFNIEDDSEEYIAKMKQYAEYAKSKGVEIGGYSLLASRRIGDGQDVVMPPGERPTFGNSPCIGSEWGQTYFKKLYNFYEKTGFALLEHDGSYPGDVCTSEDHPGHRGYGDSRWNQYQVIADFYKWCRANGIYLNVPDYYYMTGSNKCGMGYREVNWSLPRAQQVLHTRQNIYDGAWTKTPSMGWMFVPLTEYHGGGEAATIEPLNEHLDHYQKMMVSNLGGGVQACYRGPRLFDTEETKAMVKASVDWFKKHREVLEGDILHLRRADGRDIDYWLNVNPGGEEKGLFMVFNPLDRPVTRTVEIPLYYTGLTDEASVSKEDGAAKTYTLSRDYKIRLEVEVPANGYSWYVIK
ncbi:hypothetical protein [Flavilitoribacter nigricans]|uniref:Alpha-galactosidase n=1 Tax=Flavilitoribacter nigricans (strain ATCC 23147 / DSM 23189 / NBRC 102662 / NCIMB 1420 / SS-2) TaxID=1122177 RepID=A0A2D0NDK5_FLAN2|nr:hypothetical protein [Flavilitoribacter nigricans]PHN06565.1 hypothetical protein CRP01_09680 [Flavilitoribacter nigricans DSM 23189 = NBRC 102662]